MVSKDRAPSIGAANIEINKLNNFQNGVSLPPPFSQKFAKNTLLRYNIRCNYSLFKEDFFKMKDSKDNSDFLENLPTKKHELTDKQARALANAIAEDPKRNNFSPNVMGTLALTSFAVAAIISPQVVEAGEVITMETIEAFIGKCKIVYKRAIPRIKDKEQFIEDLLTFRKEHEFPLDDPVRRKNESNTNYTKRLVDDFFEDILKKGKEWHANGMPLIELDKQIGGYAKLFELELDRNIN